MLEIIPGIFAEDEQELTEKIALVAQFSPWVHLDIADGTLTNSTSMITPEKLKQIITKFNQPGKELSFETHLLVARPNKLMRAIVDAGVKRVIAHVESEDPRLFLTESRFESVEVGMAIDLATELEQLEPFLEEIDFAVVLTTEAGAAGQPLQQEALEKIKAIRQNFPDLPIEVAGGINDQTIRQVKEAGATRVISDSFLFQNPAKIQQTLELLQNI